MARRDGLFTRRLLYLRARYAHPSALEFRLGRAEVRGLATDPATHSQRRTVRRMRGEVQRSAEQPQVMAHVTAVCKTVGSVSVLSDSERAGMIRTSGVSGSASGLSGAAAAAGL